MRKYATIAAALLLAGGLGGCGLGPGTGGPQLAVVGPDEAVSAFVRQQGAHRPTRATTFPAVVDDGRSSARVLMPAGTSAATMTALAREATAAGLRAKVVAGQ
jgi:hypothetical protein